MTIPSNTNCPVCKHDIYYHVNYGSSTYKRLHIDYLYNRVGPVVRESNEHGCWKHQHNALLQDTWCECMYFVDPFSITDL